MKIRAVIIDDEISAVNSLRGMLEEYFPDVILAGQAVSIPQALTLLEQQKPDLIFLDIQIPPWGTGFDLLRKIPRRDFGVVFTTAYPNYALQAIQEAQPWGYLVKPIRLTELRKTLEIAREKLGTTRASRKLVFADKHRGNVVIIVSDILYCKAGGSTSDVVYVEDNGIQKFTCSRTLGELETDLTAMDFFRPHHSFIVNMARISNYRQTGRNGEIHLPFNNKVPISINKLSAFEEAFRAYVVGG